MASKKSTTPEPVAAPPALPEGPAKRGGDRRSDQVDTFNLNGDLDKRCICVRCGAPLDPMGNPIIHNSEGPFCGTSCGDLHARGL